MMLGLTTEASLGVLAIGVMVVYFHLRFNATAVDSGPTILTTTGIFATFLGIALGLLHFDTANIQSSVPALLAGLKTAFWASVVGVGGALSLKLRQLVSGTPESVQNAHELDAVAAMLRELQYISALLREKNPEPLLAALMQSRLEHNDRMDRVHRTLGEQILPVLQALNQQAFSKVQGEQLFLQLSELRQDSNSRLEQLAAHQSAMLEQALNQQAFSKAQGEQLFLQLSELRQDSNSRLDQLAAAQTAALEKLSEMSSKTLIEALREVIHNFNDKITEQFGDNFRHLSQAVQQLLDWQAQYRSSIEQLVQQQSQTADSMQLAAQRYSQLLQDAEGFVQVAAGLQTLLDGLHTQKNQLQHMLAEFSRLVSQTAEGLPHLEERVAGLTAHMMQTLQSHQEQTSRMMEKISQQSDEMLAKNVRQHNEFNASVEKVVGDSINSLARTLAALTSKFTTDYDQLAEALQRISQVTRRNG